MKKQNWVTPTVDEASVICTEANMKPNAIEGINPGGNYFGQGTQPGTPDEPGGPS